MALFGIPSSPLPRTPATRYLSTNPLRREQGIRLLTYSLPEPLRALLIRALRRPPRFVEADAPLIVQAAYRSLIIEADFASATVTGMQGLARVVLEATRRTIEAPLGSISRVTRNTLLVTHGNELRCLYLALSARMGQAAALAVFQYALDAVGQG
jgi:hypothetical protein